MTSKESSIYQNYESHSNKWGIFLYYNQTIKIFYLFLIIHTTCMCPFDQRAVINHCIIEAKSAGKVVCFISISFQNTARNITAQPTLAY